MRAPALAPLATLCLVAACSQSGPRDAAAGGGDGATQPAAAAQAMASPATASIGAITPQAPCRDYRADLEDGDMAMIYQAAAGLTPPFDHWADLVLARSPRDANPEAAWSRAKAQVQAQWRAVSQIRCVSLRTAANIQAYDPSRGGLIVQSLAPDHYFTFGDDVRLTLRNAERAYVWKMPADRAEALFRGSNSFGGAELVARLHILSARPSGAGGVIEADVDSFDIAPAAYSRAAPATVTVEPAP